MSASEDRSLASKLVDQELSRWEGNLRQLWEEWDGYWEKWAITTPDDADNPYQSREQVPYPHSAVETLIPRILGEEPSMTYTATEDPDDELAAELCGAAATWQMQLMSFDAHARDFVRQGLITGFSAAKVFWLREVGVHQEESTETAVHEIGDLHVPIDHERIDEHLVVTRNEGRFEPVFYRDFVYPLTAKSVDHAPAIWQRTWASRQYLVEMAEAGFYRNVDEIRMDGTSNYSDAHRHQLQIQKLSPQLGTDEDIDNLVEVWERWTDERLVVIANRDIVIRDDPNPFHHAKKPFITYAPTPWPFQMHGIGVVKQINDLVESLNTIRRQMRDAVTYTLMPMFKLLENVDETEVVIRPGGHIHVNDMEDVQPMYPPSVNFADGWQQANAIAADIQRTTGAFDYLTGASDAPGASTTATGVATITNEGNKRVEEQIKVFHHSMIRFGYLLLSNLLQWLPDEVAVNFSRSPKALEVWNQAQEVYEEPARRTSLVAVSADTMRPVGRLMPIPKVGADKRMTDIQRRSDMVQVLTAIQPFLVVPGAMNVPALLRWALDQVGIDAQTREEIIQPEMGQVLGAIPGLQPGGAPPQESGPSGDNQPTGQSAGAPGVTGPSGPPGQSPNRGSSNNADLSNLPLALRQYAGLSQ